MTTEKNETVIGAIRIAMEGSDSDTTRISLIESLLQAAPPTPDSDTTSVKLLLDCVKALDGTFVVPA